MNPAGSRSVGVVTDSAASLPVELVAQLPVAVAPLQMTIDGVPIPEDETNLTRVINALQRVQTSAPSPGSFAKCISEVDSGLGVVVLTVSERFSASLTAARLGAKLCNSQVELLDTGTAAGGQALVVLAAARAAAAGGSLDEVARRATHVAEKVRLVATVDSLDQLVRGGRVPGLAGWAGRQLGVRPLFEMAGGRIRPLRPALSRGRATDGILAQWRRSVRAGQELHVAALHALDPSSAEELLDSVRHQVTPVEAFVTTFGAGMVAHTGPGVRGLAWWWDALEE